MTGFVRPPVQNLVFVNLVIWHMGMELSFCGRIGVVEFGVVRFGVVA